MLKGHELVVSSGDVARLALMNKIHVWHNVAFMQINVCSSHYLFYFIF